MLAELTLDPRREADRISGFIHERLAEAGFHRAVLGVSGGIDSALVAALCVRALGADNVFGMVLPCENSNPSSAAHGRMVVEQLGMPSSDFDITPMYMPLLAREPEMGGLRLGNVMSRLRMVTLYDQSVAFNGLVMGTGNRTEWLLGYFTLYGDGASALKPISHLYKCQVRALATYLGISDEIVHKAPSADLWEGQTDEGDLGFSYDEADQIILLLSEMGESAESVAARGFDLRTVQAVQRTMRRTAFKRTMPAMLDTVWQSDHTPAGDPA
ncbi:MAG: NAD+ synthase [Anaerolineae bacterium]